MVLVGEHEEPPSRVGAQRLEPVVHREVLILHFVQHHRQHHDILNRRILQQIDLVEHDVGVDDEDGGRVGVEAAGGHVAGGAGEGAAGDVVAEVVLPDHLDDAALLRLLHEGLALQHVGELGGARGSGGGGKREEGGSGADLRRRMAAAAMEEYRGLIG